MSISIRKVWRGRARKNGEKTIEINDPGVEKKTPSTRKNRAGKIKIPKGEENMGGC
jgi:hypothetical protein